MNCPQCGNPVAKGLEIFETDKKMLKPIVNQAVSLKN